MHLERHGEVRLRERRTRRPTVIGGADLWSGARQVMMEAKEEAVVEAAVVEVVALGSG